MSLADDKHNLLFGIQRSIRYHDRRLAHFENLHKLTNICTIFISGIVLLELTGSKSPDWVKWLAAVAAILGAFDLVVGYGLRSNQHRDLRRRFCVLERKLITSNSEDEILQAQAERSEIEADEPPVFRALDTLCHNEMCAAKGWSRTHPEECAHYRKLRWYARATANWIHWSNIGEGMS